MTKVASFDVHEACFVGKQCDVTCVCCDMTLGNLRGDESYPLHLGVESEGTPLASPVRRSRSYACAVII